MFLQSAYVTDHCFLRNDADFCHQVPLFCTFSVLNALHIGQRIKITCGLITCYMRMIQMVRIIGLPQKGEVFGLSQKRERCYMRMLRTSVKCVLYAGVLGYWLFAGVLGYWLFEGVICY
jgi:hypothetical protein